MLFPGTSIRNQSPAGSSQQWWSRLKAALSSRQSGGGSVKNGVQLLHNASRRRRRPLWSTCIFKRSLRTEQILPNLSFDRHRHTHTQVTSYHCSSVFKVNMSDLLYVDLTYCTLCDRYFPGSDARRHHVQVSSNHPKCDTCNRRFANKNSLRNVSSAHSFYLTQEKLLTIS